MQQVSPIFATECRAAYRRLNEAAGPLRRHDVNLGDYARRLAEMAADPSKAGPHLERAVRLWSKCVPPKWADSGDQPPDIYDSFVRRLRACIDAIDDDDEQKRLESAAQAVEPPYHNAEEAAADLQETKKLLDNLMMRVCSGPRKTDSPFYNADKAAAYLGMTKKALYNRVERVCGGTRKRQKYLFTKEELDMLRRGINPWKKEK
jgi:hypothetical protein